MSLRTHEINALLRQRYCAPEWAIFFEVQNGTGASGRTRYADALAMNLFPSRGLELHGFEVKVSKSDWRRELSLPHKAEAHFKNCDRWWVVAPKGIVDKDELPPTWGLILADETGLRQTVQAPKLTPEQWSRNFVAAILRRSHEREDAEIEAIVGKRVNEAAARNSERIENEVKRRTARIEEQLARVREVENASGIKLTDWNADKHLGEIIGLMRRARVLDDYSGISSALTSLQNACKHLGEAVEKIEEMRSTELRQ